jgi:predicted nucleotidyltransferase
MSKFSRAKAALSGGVDLVLELPVLWAVAPAYKFALGGVAIADALGCADILSFGSECGDVDALRSAADALSAPETAGLVREKMTNGEGISFAVAREQAVRELFGEAAAAVLSSPNDILAAEYIAAARRLSSSLQFETVRRTGAKHDSLLPPSEGGEIASASYIRTLMASAAVGERTADETASVAAEAEQETTERDTVSSATGKAATAREEETGERAEFLRYLPAATTELLLRDMERGHAPADMGLLERAILCKLRCMSREQLSQLPEVSEGLENRLFDAVAHCGTLTELYDTVKTKRYPHSRIRRIVLSSFLSLPDVAADCTPPYIRILGANAKGREILSAARPKLPIVAKYADVRGLSEFAREVFALECTATDLWGMAVKAPLHAGLDMKNKLIML